MSNRIKLTHGALDDGEGGKIILRGVLAPEHLHLLKTADYQREVLPLCTIEKLCQAFEDGSVPDIELGMRGEKVSTGPDDTYFLDDDVFIVDGLQRVTAALHLMKKGSKSPHLGATVHFGTTEEWERERFRILNADRTKLSPNVLARNMRHTSEAIELLYRLSGDTQFVLKGRISWSQRMGRDQLITAILLLKCLGQLHSKFGPGKATMLNELARGLDKIMVNVKRSVFKDNVRTFFDLVDECWGVRRVAFKAGATYLKGTFLCALAQVLADHEEFWRDKRLTVTSDWRRKIASFPTSDPMVIKLSSSGGQARQLLYSLLLNHINSGKRTKRLKGFVNVKAAQVHEEQVEAETANA